MLQREVHLNLTMRDLRGRYTLDELLQVKRAEKPSPDFWNKFENDLRIKQRRQLQRQPVEDLGEEVSIWQRFRNFSLLCGAATSCGVVGFVVMQMLNPDSVTSSFEEASVPSPQEFAVAEIKPTSSFAEQTVEEPVFFEVAHVDTVVPHLPERAEDTESSSQPTELASVKPIQTSTLPDSYILEIETPFQSINIDETIAFNADENITTKLMEKYIHPLSDRGWKHTQLVSHQADPLNRVTAMALESKLFSGDSRSEIKWNALTLRF